MTLEQRIALAIGSAILRTITLEAEVEMLRAKVKELEEAHGEREVLRPD